MFKLLKDFSITDLLKVNDTNNEIISYLNKINTPFEELEDQELFDKLAQIIDEGKVIGWFNGPMEFGPRALGARSIIADPRRPDVIHHINKLVKN